MEAKMEGECNFEEMRTIESQVNWLEDIRSEGNKMFAERNWAAAVSKYSDCINSAAAGGGQLHTSNALLDPEMQEKLNRAIMLAHSNRAEASLRLLKYEDALQDAALALQIDSKHAKSLVRKGKAAHGLGFFEQACEAFKCALVEFPEDQSVVGLLTVSSVALEQSRTGDYDLLDFFSQGCTGSIPSCADFVGPVEIRRTTSGGNAPLGLFATRSVELGELLLVNNPLAVVRHATCNADGTAKFWRAEGLEEKLLPKLVERVGRSTLERARLYSLANKGEQEREIPSMELFRPGSKWTSPDQLNLEVDVDLIGNIANEKIFDFVDVTNPYYKRANDLYTGVMGLWVLPAFAKHSCAPNCQHSFVGDTIFFRASGHITEGEELTIPYFADLFTDVKVRQAISKEWGFICNCERCLFEKSVQPQFSVLKKKLESLAAGFELLEESPDMTSRKRELSLIKERGKATIEVEAVIRSLGAGLSPRKQDWIRTAFVVCYLSRGEPFVDELDHRSFVLSLRSVLDALTSVYVTPRALTVISMLSVQLDRTSFEQTQLKEFRDKMFSVYQRVYGKQPDTVLDNLIKLSIPKMLFAASSSSTSPCIVLGNNQ